MAEFSHICSLRSLSSYRKRIPFSSGESLSPCHKDDHMTSQHLPCYTKNCPSYSPWTVSSSISECWLINPCLGLVSHFCFLIKFSDTMRDLTSWGRQKKQSGRGKTVACPGERRLYSDQREWGCLISKNISWKLTGIYIQIQLKLFASFQATTEVKIISRKDSKRLHNLFPLTLRYPLQRG